MKVKTNDISRIVKNDSTKITDNLFKVSEQKTDEVLYSFNTTEKGLTHEEADNRLELYGPNIIATEKAEPWYIQLAKAFWDPFILVLLGLALISVCTDVLVTTPKERSFEAVIVITIMVVISVVLKFSQEYRSNMAAEQLKALVNTTTAVIRSDAGRYEIDMRQIVPGDIIYLAAGDMIPADMRLISAKDLFVSQSALTGESLPMEKRAEIEYNNENEKTMSITDIENICFLGTNIISGAAQGIVVATGDNTYFGSMAKSLIGQRAQTSFDKGVRSVTQLLIRFMMIMVPIVFLINGITKGDWLQALLFAVSVAVGLTPEMLPMVVTSNLAKGALTMAKKKTVVKHLSAIQNFGAINILCTDKTGTLTLDKIVLERYLDVHGNEDVRVLRHAYLNSYFQTGLKNLIDIAVIRFGKKQGLGYLDEIYTKVDEIPFDFNRRRMSVILEDTNKKRQLVTKGAVEEMLSICSHAEYKGRVILLTGYIKNKIKQTSENLNQEGMRVLAVAQKNYIPYDREFDVSDEKDMVLMGYIGFLDPPKDTAAAAIKALDEHGVEVKILTGDNEFVTKTICKQVGLSIEHIFLGHELEDMTDEQLALETERTTVFAKLSPLQKSRIIKVLQNQGNTVGYLGDGINDAAALKESDIGISVDTGVDIAKESADIILLEKDLMVLEKGILEGRRIFGNIIKYIKMTVSSNFGNVFSVLTASAFLPFLPMLPIHLLIQNLLYDISQIAIPWDNMDEEYLKAPRRWDSDSLQKFTIYIGPISSIFDIITFIVMWFIFNANTPEVQGLFHSGWFIIGLLTQTLVVHMLRTEKIPFIQSKATAPVTIMTGIIMAIGVFIPFSPFGASIGFQPLPIAYFPWMLAIVLSYCILTQLVKMWYIRRFAEWL